MAFDSLFMFLAYQYAPNTECSEIISKIQELKAMSMILTVLKILHLLSIWCN